MKRQKGEDAGIPRQIVLRDGARQVLARQIAVLVRPLRGIRKLFEKVEAVNA